MPRRKTSEIKALAYHAMEHLTRHWPPNASDGNSLNIWNVEDWTIGRLSSTQPNHGVIGQVLHWYLKVSLPVLLAIWC